MCCLLSAAALGSLGEKLPAEQAAALAQQIVGIMEKTTDRDALSSLGGALGSLPRRMSVDDTISVLKSLVCVGDTRNQVLAGLEQKAARKFDGNLWRAVEWAEEQGIDVRNVPRYPLAAAE